MLHIQKMNAIILELQIKYIAASKGKHDLLKKISIDELAENVYNSNALENSTLSYIETKKILSESNVDRYVTKQEITEAINLAYVMKLVNTQQNNNKITIEYILLLHKKLLLNIEFENAGKFRSEHKESLVGNNLGVEAIKITSMLENAINNFYTTRDKNIIKKISKFHLEFEKIHPFRNGSGRIGRIILNHLLINDGFPPINIKFINSYEYHQSIAEYIKLEKLDTMNKLIYLALANSLHKRLAHLENKNIISLNKYAKMHYHLHPFIFQKARNQTIEAFYENNTWKIGI